MSKVISFYPVALVASEGCAVPTVMEPVGDMRFTFDAMEAALLMVALDWDTLTGTGFIDDPLEMSFRCVDVAQNPVQHERIRELARYLYVVCEQAVLADCVVGFC